MKYTKLKTLALASLSMLGVAAILPAQAYESPIHIFSIEDVMGGFDGATFGPNGTYQDPSVICGATGSTVPVCPGDVTPIIDKEGVTLYPIDSEFGFFTVDFLGAEEKLRDAGVTADFLEGFAGNIMDGTSVIGIKVSNASTDTYKVKPPLGTWCQGLGGTSIKCSTEHYSVMEHVLSCHEVLPYFFADPEDGTQEIREFPDYLANPDSFDCADAELDNDMYVLNNGALSGIYDPVFNPMAPNDNTTVLNDIATSTDYSITLKDDGKVLYRWGSLIKRPNDVRLYARLALPDEWKVPSANDYTVTRAQLVVTHWITNNPNDQLRPEDLENEAATGRKPNYMVEGDQWLSIQSCYEGDGDYLESEEGSTDPLPIPAGTVLKNGRFAGANLVAASPPQLLSADLREGFTNGYYTTINRDPFEWSYRVDLGDPDIYEFRGSALPLTDSELAAQSLSLVSGPRWRLKSNKFGQDIPGLEIPLEECSPPPFTRENIKYEVGETVTTIINLLDWDEVKNGPSPLATSHGWVDVTNNGAVTIADTVNGIPVTTNGLPMTEDFDLAVYIKGDKKPTAVYNARLVLEYEGETPPVPVEFDVAITEVVAPESAILGTVVPIDVTIQNLGPAATTTGGFVYLACVDNRGGEFNAQDAFDPLADDDEFTTHFEFATAVFDPPDSKQLKVDCEVSVLMPDDVNLANNNAEFSMKVKKP